MADPEKIHRAVIDLLADGFVSISREQEQMAQGYVVLSIDQEGPKNGTSAFGPFETSIEALAWAEAHHADVNKASEGPGHGWDVTVLPILPVTP